tara:strand:+ start:2456 stop:3439 length:984 start_codon:yes stop_codon:yes gene_type:complete
MILKNKFAIGCLVQWYEIDLIGEYIESLKQSLKEIENKENVHIDFVFTVNQDLERIDDTTTMEDIGERFDEMINELKTITPFVRVEPTAKLVTVADYRREFNSAWCEVVDVLMWGETDSLIPKQTFQILDNLHDGVKEQTPKYVGFFGTCKMWDESWKPIEHSKFTDKPFIEDDDKNWWSLKYNMTLKEMNEINDDVEDLDVQVVNPYKFNGCGLVISSEVIKAGVNIPKSVFFVHEDTAFLNVMQRMFGDSIPQYVIKNVLLVHNRKHPKKRNHVLGEGNIENKEIGAKRLAHDWYMRANKMCEHNAYNLFTQNKTYSWKDIFEDR